MKDLVQIPFERTAEDALRNAEELCKNGIYHLSYEQAVYSIEILLKAVLDKYGMFNEKTDKTHSHRRLMDKIEANNCLPDYSIERIHEIFSSVNHINLTSGSGNHMDCASECLFRLIRPVIPVKSSTHYNTKSDERDFQLKVEALSDS